MTPKIALITTSLLFSITLPSLAHRSDSLSLTLSEAIEIAHNHNISLSVAREGIATAHAERREFQALWFPTVTIAGEYSHTLTEIAAVTSLGELAGEGLDVLEDIFTTTAPPLASVVNAVAASELCLPLVPRNTASLGVEIVWTIFSGGRRIQASRISQALLSLAQERLCASENAVRAGVTEAYFGVCMAESALQVRRESREAFALHLRQAQFLEREGAIVPAERIVAEVALKQAEALVAEAEGELEVARHTLRTLLNIDSLTLHPTTPLFVPHNIPPRSHFDSLVNHSPLLGILRQQSAIATHTLDAERSRYLPSVALLAHQQLWSTGLNKNLFPRTFVGVGLSWTLFDGLAREGAIARSHTLVTTAKQELQRATQQLRLAIDRLYSALYSAESQYAVSTSTERLAEELARSRRRAFAEGMATSSEVVDAEVLLCEARLGTMAALYAIDTSLSSLLMTTGRTEDFLDYISPTK